MSALALAAGYSSSEDDSDLLPSGITEKKAAAAAASAAAVAEERRNRPSGRDFFSSGAEQEAGQSGERREGSGEGAVVGKKRPLPKESALLDARNTPAFIEHTVQSIKQQMPRVAPVTLEEERPISDVVKAAPAKKGLMDQFKERKLRAKAVSSVSCTRASAAPRALHLACCLGRLSLLPSGHSEKAPLLLVEPRHAQRGDCRPTHMLPRADIAARSTTTSLRPS